MNYLRPIPDNPEAEERFPEVVMAELEDGSEAGMTETSRSSDDQDWGKVPYMRIQLRNKVSYLRYVMLNIKLGTKLGSF